MSKEKFRIIREKLFESINKNLIPKYDILDSCHMYESSELGNWDVEFIFKLNSSLTPYEKNSLEIKIKNDLRKFLNEVCGMPHYILAILIILDDTGVELWSF